MTPLLLAALAGARAPLAAGPCRDAGVLFPGALAAPCPCFTMVRGVYLTSRGVGLHRLRVLPKRLRARRCMALCVSSLTRGHTNLVCFVPIILDALHSAFMPWPATLCMTPIGPHTTAKPHPRTPPRLRYNPLLPRLRKHPGDCRSKPYPLCTNPPLAPGRWAHDQSLLCHHPLAAPSSRLFAPHNRAITLAPLSVMSYTTFPIPHWKWPTAPESLVTVPSCAFLIHKYTTPHHHTQTSRSYRK